MTTDRTCESCSASLEGRRSDARFCDRRCKTRASDRRRIEDGREQARNLARYPGEAERRRRQAGEWQAANAERMRVVRRRRKGQVRSSIHIFTDRDWARLVARFRGCCAYCGESAPLQREHVIPLARGGRHSVGNILPACARCNYSKHTSTVMEWRLRERRREVIPHPHSYTDDRSGAPRADLGA